MCLALLISAHFPASATSTPNRNCFTHHINEAIQLNLQRGPLYDHMTGGRSLHISDELISLEKSMKFKSFLIDTWARFFQIQGINVLCNELVDMSKTPPFSERLPLEARPNANDYRKVDIKKLQNSLSQKMSQSLNAIASESKLQIQNLQTESRFNCMTRHFLESIYIFSTRGQNYIQQVSPLQRPHLKFFIKRIIKSHIDYLAQASRLDLMAKELQSEGYPILCQDIPPIDIQF